MYLPYGCTPLSITRDIIKNLIQVCYLELVEFVIPQMILIFSICFVLFSSI